MKKQHPLFRWIFGGLTAASVAVAGSSPPTATPSPPSATSATQAQPAESAPVSALPEQSGQIWGCTTNGVKTFSNNPCGAKSFRVALRPINTMTPTPIVRSARANGSALRYSKEYTDQNWYPNQETSSEGSDGNAYPFDQGYQGYQGFIYAPLVRPNQDRRPEHHHDSSSEPPNFAARPNHPAPAPHRPASVPRRN